MRNHWIRSALLLAAVVGSGAILAGWKLASIEASDAGLASQPEPMESIAVALAKPVEHRPTTTAVGTVVALRSITLRNELAGTVSYVGFKSGQVVPRGALLVRMDTAEERARLAAQTARAAVAAKNLERSQELVKRGFISQAQVDLLVSDARTPGKGAVVEGTFQAPIMVQWRPAPGGVRHVHVALTRFE